MSSVAVRSPADVRRLVVALLAGAVLSIVAVVGWQLAGAWRAADDRAATATYADALQPLASDAGRVVELGLKEGLQQVASTKGPDPALARSARSYRRQLTGVADRLAALDTPGTLDDGGFAAAILGYAEAAAMLERAALVPASRRQPLLDEITWTGRAADEQWDAAAQSVQDHLRQVGLPPAAWLPG
jgi:hypothetical protein